MSTALQLQFFTVQAVSYSPIMSNKVQTPPHNITNGKRLRVGRGMKSGDPLLSPGYFLMAVMCFHWSGLSHNTRQTAHFSMHLTCLKMRI